MGIEVKGGVGVVVQIHIHLVAYLTVHAQVNLLVEVEAGGLTVTDGQRGVIDVLHRGTQLQLCRSLGFDTHTARAEDFFRRSQVEVHVGKRELVLALVRHILGILLAEEVVEGPLLTPLQVFLRGHQHGGVQIAVAYLRAYIVDVL